MIELTNMSDEELHELAGQIKAELAKRQTEELVVYIHFCADRSNHHKTKYKHWTKLVDEVDTTKSSGYAFLGNFLQFGVEHKVPKGSVIVETCDDDVYARLMDGSENPIFVEAKRGKMSNLIDAVAKELLR